MIVKPLLFAFLTFLCALNSLAAQKPFECTGQFFIGMTTPGSLLHEVTYTPATQVVEFNTINSQLSVSVDALGFSRADNLIYGWDYHNDDNLFRIDANGNAEVLGSILLHEVNYYGGDVTPNGRFLVLLGSGVIVPGTPTSDIELAIIDLFSPDYEVEFVPVPSENTLCFDIAFDPLSGILYSFDGKEKRLIVFDYFARKILKPFPPTNLTIAGALFFDPFGQLYAYGSITGAEKSVLFKIDKYTGEATPIGNGPLTFGVDGCACPYSVDMQKIVSPDAVSACSEVIYSFHIVNSTGQTYSGIDLVDALPKGLSLLEVLRNPFDGVNESTAQYLHLRNLTLPPGLDSIIVKVSVGTVAEGEYFNQAVLLNLPKELGNIRLSDNGATPLGRDKTRLVVAGNNCEIETKEKDYRIHAPNVFSPNGDGMNDRFFLQSNDITALKNLRIFSRWGELVFKAENMPVNDYSAGWDGHFDGKESGNGVFVWMAEIEMMNGELRREYGNVAIIK